jgi:hypothetical protein
MRPFRDFGNCRDQTGVLSDCFPTTTIFQIKSAQWRSGFAGHGRVRNPDHDDLGLFGGKNQPKLIFLARRNGQARFHIKIYVYPCVIVFSHGSGYTGVVIFL